MPRKQTRKVRSVPLPQEGVESESAQPNPQWLGDFRLHGRVGVTEERSCAAEAAGWKRGANWKRDLHLLIQRGPQEMVPWSSALNAMRIVLEADHVAMILRRPSPSTPALIIDASAESVKEWRGGYAYYRIYSCDPFSGLPQDHVVSVDEVVGAEAWEASAFNQRYIKPLGMRYRLGADLVSDGGVECRLRISRAAAGGDFGSQERAICDELLPYIKVSIDVHAQLDAQRMQLRAYAHAMEQLLIGVAVFDEKGTLIHTNGIADDILEEGNGVRVSSGKVHVAFRNEDREVQRALQDALQETPSTERPVGTVLSISRPSGRSKIGLLVRAIPFGTWSQGQRRPAAVMFFRDPEKCAASSSKALHSLFHLTRAESMLAAQLVDGRSLDEAAKALHITRNTARAQLRSIFTKTGASRQSMLVRLLLNSVATMGEADDAAPAARGAGAGSGAWRIA